MSGAEQLASWKLGASPRVRKRADEAIQRALPKEFKNTPFHVFNDSVKTTHAQVMYVFDRILTSRSPRR